MRSLFLSVALMIVYITQTKGAAITNQPSQIVTTNADNAPTIVPDTDIHLEKRNGAATGAAIGAIGGFAVGNLPGAAVGAIGGAKYTFKLI